MITNAILKEVIPPELKLKNIRPHSHARRLNLANRLMRCRTPLLNKKAVSIKELIDWSKDKVFEPVLSCWLSRTELSQINSEKMIVPKFPIHEQSIERCFQAVTRASSSVFGHEQRDGFIKATLDHRKLMPAQQSKQDLRALYQM